MKRKTNQQVAALTNRTTFRVRFSEIDSMQIVWHGEYVRYFEDGREAFGKQYGLDYMSIYREGYMVPIVDLTCQFKQSLSFGEKASKVSIIYTFRKYVNKGTSKGLAFVTYSNEKEIVVD